MSLEGEPGLNQGGRTRWIGDHEAVDLGIAIETKRMIALPDDLHFHALLFVGRIGELKALDPLQRRNDRSETFKLDRIGFALDSVEIKLMLDLLNAQIIAADRPTVNRQA